MVLDKLSNSLKDTLSKIKNSLTVDRELVEEIIKEIQKLTAQRLCFCPHTEHMVIPAMLDLAQTVFR